MPSKYLSLYILVSYLQGAGMTGLVDRRLRGDIAMVGKDKVKTGVLPLSWGWNRAKKKE